MTSEFGNIDHDGQDRGWKLAKHLDSLLAEIHERIAALLATGWSRVRVVTDHGWLLVPGELPKIDLSSTLTATKWGRCAALKPGAATDERLYPWFWNPNHYFALADGVSCFRKGEDYAPSALRQRLLCGGRHAACPPASWADLAAARGLKSAFVLPIPKDTRSTRN